MVYLIESIKQLKTELEKNSLGSLAYYYLNDKKTLSEIDLDQFVGLELVAAKGFLSIPITEQESQKILKPGYKGVDISSSIFKLVGAYLADPAQVKSKLNKKFEETTLRNQFFISCFSDDHKAKFYDLLKLQNLEGSFIFQVIAGLYVPSAKDTEKMANFLQSASDVIDLLILEELNKKLIEIQIPAIRVTNLSAYDTFIRILENFPNAVKKVSQARRKGHDSYKINDEYDVQDILYVILKSLFPSLKEEDPTPKVGAKSNKIDLILREEGILLEVKMIKESDTNEKEFIEQLKVDIQSYYNCPWLKHLICFVYDPQIKTKDKHNFYDLNGTQTINDITFTVQVIVNPV